MSESTSTAIVLPEHAKPPNRVQRWIAAAFGVLYRWAESGWSRSAVGTWSFLQSSVVPGPSDALLVPLGLADPRRAFDLAVWAIIGSVFGGLLAYGIGALAFDQLGAPVLAFMGVGDQALERFSSAFAERGWELVVIGMLPLLSAKAICIAAGAFGVPLAEFTLAIFATRTVRFFVTAALLRYAGTGIARWIERRFGKRVQA